MEGDLSHLDETASSQCSRAVEQGTCDSEQHAFDSSQRGQRYEVRQYCHDIGVSLEFASPNTRQHIGSNERVGRTIAGIMRCLLVDSGLPHFLWGELMQTAVYVCNRVPHAASANETP